MNRQRQKKFKLVWNRRVVNNMCGIFGVIDKAISPPTLESCRDSLTNRGPDDAGIFLDQGVGFGHRRLSIIDLTSNATQPMSAQDGSLWITFNGEIYNYRALRTELEVRGYAFRTKSDTEVILHAYEEWGRDCVHKFRGMWSFALYDKRKQKVYLCRDRVGVKPLYYSLQGSTFLFGSELKALIKYPAYKKEVDHRSLSLFFQFGYIPAPFSIFKNTFKLESAHWLEIALPSLDMKKYCYWDVSDYYLKGITMKREGYWNSRSLTDITHELEEILTEGIQLRMVSDVPVGVFLSSGVDSALVTALLAKNHQNLKTFTIGFHGDNLYNEAPRAKEIARYLKTDHTEHYFKPEDIMPLISTIQELYDEPFGDSSALPTYLVSKIASKKVKVVLSADGGDELFAGYNHFYFLEKYKKIIRLASVPGMRKILSNVGISTFIETASLSLKRRPLNVKKKIQKIFTVADLHSLSERFLALKEEYTASDRSALGLSIPHPLRPFKAIENSLDPLSLFMTIDFDTYLPDDILTKVDRASMGVSIENREPLLDNKIIEFTATLPSSLKYRNGERKFIARRVLERHLPLSMLNSRKQGFSIPFEHPMYKNELMKLTSQYLTQQTVKEFGFVNYATLEKFLNEWRRGSTTNVKIWLLLVLHMWGKRYL